MIKIQTHGGRCCGIKSIHGFYSGPNGPIAPKKRQRWEARTDIDGNSVSRGYNWYRPKRPKETYLQRLEEYIRYIKEKRPQGLIEITMTEYQLSGYQYCYSSSEKINYAWQPVLDRLGFKLVSKFTNSNTTKTVYVFHLTYGS